jgi:hypothetical protein
MPPQSPHAADVKIGKADPPLGSVDLGVIEAGHGHGCGGFGERGSLEGAMAVMRNKAAERGANYVALLSTMEPHLAGGCFDDRYVVSGMAYRVNMRGVPPVMSESCDPPCSPGYRCLGTVCRALCNPVCGGGQVCRQDRTCAPTDAVLPPQTLPPGDPQ